MISKELLSEVLDTTITELAFKNNHVEYTSSISGNPYYYITYDKINIYELAHKCKEWAFNNGYYLNIYNDAIDVVLKKSCKIVENITDGSFKYSPMLVFKACQWILDNKENK